MKKRVFFTLLILSILLAACAGGNSTATSASGVPSSSEQPAAPIKAAVADTDAVIAKKDMLNSLRRVLGNLSYAGIFPDHEITLKDGYFAYSEGGIGTPHVSLVDRLILTGDLNADGAQDAIFMLDDDSEGSGRLTFLVAVLSVFTNPQPLEAVILAGRSGVKSMALDGSQVVVDIVSHGPEDADCCPSWNMQVVYSLEDGQLVEKSRTERNQISLDDLDGTQWRLINIGGDQQTALPSNKITLQFDDGQISGFAGCNGYSGAVSSGDYGLNSIKLDTITPSSQEPCSDQVASQEKSFLEALASASAWLYEYGSLALIYGMGEDQIDKLLLEPIHK